MIANNDKVDPKFVRRLEILEALMVGFLETVSSPEGLDFAEKRIYQMSV